MATALIQHLRDLEAFLRKDRDAPLWNEFVLVLDTDMMHGRITRIRRNALRSPEQFSRDFDDLARAGYGWINLVGNGVLEGRLLVSVELPKASSHISPEMVPVNVSGPYADSEGNKIWNLEGRVELVEG